MTNPNYTALAFCVDRSGSMMDVKDDAEGAIASLLSDQKDVGGRCDIMMCDFSTEWQLVYSLRPIQNTPHYFLTPSGGTALLDAIAATITELGLQLEALPEQDRPAHVIVAIQTDGHENSSRKTSLASVKEMIKHQQEVYNWKFLFLGAGIDAVEAGTGLGIARGQTMSYSNDREGTYSMAGSVSAYVSATRAGHTPTTLDPESE